MTTESATCAWREEDPWGPMPDTYATSCGELWSFTDGGPAENRVKFCHRCGKPVEVVPYSQPVDEDAPDGVKPAWLTEPPTGQAFPTVGKLFDALDVPVAHTDHPMRHYDRTCPACNPDGVPVAYPTDGERDLAALCARLVRRLREVSPDDKLAATATDYLNQRRYLNPLRIKALEKAAPGVKGDGNG